MYTSFRPYHAQWLHTTIMLHTLFLTATVCIIGMTIVEEKVSPISMT